MSQVRKKARVDLLRKWHARIGCYGDGTGKQIGVCDGRHPCRFTTACMAEYEHTVRVRVNPSPHHQHQPSKIARTFNDLMEPTADGPCGTHQHKPCNRTA